MALTRKYFKFLIMLLLYLKVAEASERNKRNLKFPQRTSLSVGVALLSLYPKGPLSEGFLQFLEFDLGYPMSKDVVFGEMEAQKKSDVASGKWTKTKKKYYYSKKKYIEKGKRTKRSSIEHEKRKLHFQIENAMTKLGYNGSSCVSRLQCELRNVSPDNSLIEELVVELFKPSSVIPQKDCEKFILSCPVSLLHIMLHSEHILTV